MAIIDRVVRIAAGLVLSACMMFELTQAAMAISPNEIVRRGKLVVGVMTDFPPYGGTDGNQQPAGYDIDVAKLMAKSLGVELELVPVTGPNRIPYLLADRIDVLVAALGINAERAKQVLFSNPYSTLDVIVMAPRQLEIKTPADLAGHTIGVTRANSADILITSAVPAGTPIKRFDDDVGSLQALVSGQVDMLGGSNINLAFLNRDFPQRNIEKKLMLRSQSNGISMRKGDTELQTWVNGFIDKAVAEGQLDEIHRRWFAGPLPTLPPMPQF